MEVRGHLAEVHSLLLPGEFQAPTQALHLGSKPLYTSHRLILAPIPTGCQCSRDGRVFWIFIFTLFSASLPAAAWVHSPRSRLSIWECLHPPISPVTSHLCTELLP